MPSLRQLLTKRHDRRIRETSSAQQDRCNKIVLRKKRQTQLKLNTPKLHVNWLREVQYNCAWCIGYIYQCKLQWKLAARERITAVA